MGMWTGPMDFHHHLPTQTKRQMATNTMMSWAATRMLMPTVVPMAAVIIIIIPERRHPPPYPTNYLLPVAVNKDLVLPNFRHWRQVPLPIMPVELMFMCLQQQQQHRRPITEVQVQAEQKFLETEAIKHPLNLSVPSSPRTLQKTPTTTIHQSLHRVPWQHRTITPLHKRWDMLDPPPPTFPKSYLKHVHFTHPCIKPSHSHRTWPNVTPHSSNIPRN